jgi:hypothetical protein
MITSGSMPRQTEDGMRATLARIAELACREIVLDLERAREVSDVALALLAGGLARMPQSHVVVLGLDARRERELRDLGAGHLLARGV